MYYEANVNAEEVRNLNAQAEGIVKAQYIEDFVDPLTPVQFVAAFMEATGTDRFEMYHLNPSVNSHAEFLYMKACEYVKAYDGSFEFLASLSRKMRRHGGPTDAQAKGVLNCIAAEVRRSKRPQEAPKAAPVAEAVADGPLAGIQNGTYTLIETEDDYVTIRISDWKSKADGTRVISVMTGPDNENSFTGFGSVTPAGYFRPWSRFEADARLKAAVAFLSGADTEEIGEARYAYAMRSGRCARCGRKLTVPASLHRGLGPECSGKIGA